MCKQGSGCDVKIYFIHFLSPNCLVSASTSKDDNLEVVEVACALEDTCPKPKQRDNDFEDLG